MMFKKFLFNLCLASISTQAWALWPWPKGSQTPDTNSDSARIEQLVQMRYKAHIERVQQHWMQLIPNIWTAQYAGNTGFASAGLGWSYGRQDHWETHIQFGFLPKYHSSNANMIFTTRQNLVPWSVNSNHFISFEPAVFSIFLSTIFDDEFWIHEPDKYNHGDYYRFSSKIRTNLGIGSRLSFNGPHMESGRHGQFSLYYELSTYDLAIISAIPNEKLTLGDILCLGIGIQYKFF